MACRTIKAGLELDDDRARVDVDAVHAYLTNESYWARGRSRAEVARMVTGAARVIGVYEGPAQVGFARVVSDELTTACLFDVYVLDRHRGAGVGVELVQEAVENGPHRRLRWWLMTRDAHGLYERFGFGAPDGRTMVREPRS
jgi:GNAT superfamily N-acetyltransferase